MAFPDTAILDSGSGANANPIAGNWSGPIYSGDGQIKRLSNQFANADGATGDDGSYWNAASYGTPVECYVTINTINASGGRYVECHVLGQSLGGSGTYDGYAIATAFGVDGIDCYRIDNGSYTALGSTDALPGGGAWADGDSIGIKVTDDLTDNIEIYHKTSAGAWTLVQNFTDTTYTASGRLALVISGSEIRCTNFGGGTIGGVDPNTSVTPSVVAQVLTGIAPRMDLGIRPPTLLRG